MEQATPLVGPRAAARAFASFMAPILALPRLGYLSLSYTGISDGGVRCIMPLIEQSQCLQEVDVSHNALTDSSLRLLAYWNASNRPLFKRIWSGNCFSLSVAGRCSSFCPSIWTVHTDRLWFSASKRWRRRNLHGIRCAARAMAQSTGVTTLVIEHHHLGIRESRVIAPALRLLAQLEELELVDCGINADAAVELVPHLPLLAQLSLDGNPLRCKGAIVLFNHLFAANAERLRFLSLKGCNIGDDGMAALAECVTSGRVTSTEIELEQNDETYAGWALVVEAYNATLAVNA